MSERFTITEGGYQITAWPTGRRKPWVTTIKGTVGDPKPEYAMVPWWAVQVTRLDSGEVMDGHSLGSKEDAFSVGAGMARAHNAGYPVPLYGMTPREEQR